MLCTSPRRVCADQTEAADQQQLPSFRPRQLGCSRRPLADTNHDRRSVPTVSGGKVTDAQANRLPRYTEWQRRVIGLMIGSEFWRPPVNHPARSALTDKAHSTGELRERGTSDFDLTHWLVPEVLHAGGGIEHSVWRIGQELDQAQAWYDANPGLQVHDPYPLVSAHLSTQETLEAIQAHTGDVGIDARLVPETFFGQLCANGEVLARKILETKIRRGIAHLNLAVATLETMELAATGGLEEAACGPVKGLGAGPVPTATIE